MNPRVQQAWTVAILFACGSLLQAQSSEQARAVLPAEQVIVGGGATFELPFMAANYSLLDPLMSDAGPLPTNRRVLQFVVPAGLQVDSTKVQSFDNGTGLVQFGLPPGATERSRPDPNRPGQSVRGTASVIATVSANVSFQTTKTLSQVVQDAACTSASSAVDLQFLMKGGALALMPNARPLKLKARMAASASPSEARLAIAADWGTDPLGSPYVILIKFSVTASVSSTDPSVYPVSAVAADLLSASPQQFVQNILETQLLQVSNGDIKLSGAAPELLLLYDYRGKATIFPDETVPLSATQSDKNGSFKASYRYINQYDLGAKAQSGFPPLHVSSPNAGSIRGGDACGPTALGMALNARSTFHAGEAVYDNTMQNGLAVPDGVFNAFNWTKARDWLNAATPSSSPARLPSGVLAHPIAASTSAAIARAWTRVDGLLANLQPVVIRTDLTGKTNGSLGDGHLILLLGKGENAEVKALVKEAYQLNSGDYYIVADPAGHFFANSSGKHYGSMAELMAQGVGINYGGWFAVYPAEKLRDRITKGKNVNTKWFQALTLGRLSPPFIQVDARSPVSVIVTDPLGRRTGYSSLSGTV